MQEQPTIDFSKVTTDTEAYELLQPSCEDCEWLYRMARGMARGVEGATPAEALRKVLEGRKCKCVGGEWPYEPNRGLWGTQEPRWD